MMLAFSKEICSRGSKTTHMFSNAGHKVDSSLTLFLHALADFLLPDLNLRMHDHMMSLQAINLVCLPHLHHVPYIYEKLLVAALAKGQ